MATSRDFEKLWKRYQDEFQGTGKSIVSYCQENGIIYAQFERWYKKRDKTAETQPALVPVEFTDLPGEEDNPRQETRKNPHQDPMWIRSFTIQFRNGLEIRHQNEIQFPSEFPEPQQTLGLRLMAKKGLDAYEE